MSRKTPWYRRRIAGSGILLPLLTAAVRVEAQPVPTPSAVESATDAASTPAPAPPLASPAAPPSVAPSPTAIQPTAQASPISGKLYGFIEERLEALGAEPNGDTRADGTPSRSKPFVDLAIPSFHIMAQGSLFSRYRYYFNLSAPDAEDPTFDTPIFVRNVWLETSIFGDYLKVRAGKLYRRFGLYNEILDTIPSFLGIETPVSISGDRPMLTRTTNLMLHGKASAGESTISYAVTAGKDEVSVDDNVFSPGFDLNYDWSSTLLIGTSYYHTAGTVVTDVELGSGGPPGGTAPWMARDRYQVYGGYARLALGSFLIQAEGWISPHHAVRDPERVLALAANARNFSNVNRVRMGISGSPPTADQVITDADYTYQTFDVRAAYTFEVGEEGEITPYANFEYIKNVESISDKKFGGDGEAGESPRGLAMHARVGAVIKPVPLVAFKAETTIAFYDYGTQFLWNPELFFSLSYQWELVYK
jgi:hypothetical protein